MLSFKPINKNFIRSNKGRYSYLKMKVYCCYQNICNIIVWYLHTNWMKALEIGRSFGLNKKKNSKFTELILTIHISKIIIKLFL